MSGKPRYTKPIEHMSMQEAREAGVRYSLWAAKHDGRSERAVQEDLFIGEHIPRLGDLIRGRVTCLDKGTELSALARLPLHEQDALIDRALAGERVSAVAVRRSQTLRQADPSQTLRKMRGMLAALPDDEQRQVVCDLLLPYSPALAELFHRKFCEGLRSRAAVSA